MAEGTRRRRGFPLAGRLDDTLFADAGDNDDSVDTNVRMARLTQDYSALDARYDKVMDVAAHAVAAFHLVLLVLGYIPLANDPEPSASAARIAHLLVVLLCESIPARQRVYIWYARTFGTPPPARMVHLAVAPAVFVAVGLLVGVVGNFVAFVLGMVLPAGLILLGTWDDDSFMIPNVIRDEGPLASKGDVIFDRQDAINRRRDQRESNVRNIISQN